MARPLKDIDAGEVVKLAAMQCTTREIAAFFDCSIDTIERRFAAELAKGRESGKIKLRRLQWQAAEKLDRTILIWLGKQLLGQRDKADVELTGTVSQTTSLDSEAKALLDELKMLAENAASERRKR